MKLIFDIETAPNSRSTEHYAKKTYKAPGNYSDPEKIEAYAEKARQKDLDKAALHWWSGMITCIGTCTLAGDVVMFSFSGRDIKAKKDLQIEREILVDFFNYLDGMTGVILVGKSSKDFDLPYIIGRAMFHDLGIPTALRRHEKLPITDIDHCFSYSRSCGQVSNLNNYAFGLGIQAKGGSGADAPMMFKSGHYDMLDEYCVGDLRITAEVFKRYNKIYTGGCKDERPIFDGEPA